MRLTPGFVLNAFLILSVVTGIVMFASREVRDSNNRADKSNKVHDSQADGNALRRFQIVYLAVYMTAIFSDWLQGPYVYALYEAYGFSPWDNAVLFVAGYGSSMVFGTVIGSLADWTGRKKAAVLYCLLYVVHNLTKHVNSYWVLMFGRMLGGVATSLLNSVFESWLVCEHKRRGFDQDLLSDTFSWAVFGNSMAAILAGFVAQIAADYRALTPLTTAAPVFTGGYCGPFDVSVAILMFCIVLIQVLWGENYGQQDKEAAAPAAQGMRQALEVCLADAQLLCCGAVCSLFEASMFIFIFQWTPALTDVGYEHPPYGLIFATFMVPCMLGSAVFSIASTVMQPERIGQGVLCLALGSHVVPAFSTSTALSFCAFLGFELAVGVYIPMMGVLKSRIVPEEWRSTIYNLYRAPMNLMVLGMLLTDSGPRSAFRLTMLMLGAALAAQTRLLGLAPDKGQYGAISADEQAEVSAASSSIEGGVEMAAARRKSRPPQDDAPSESPWRSPKQLSPSTYGKPNFKLLQSENPLERTMSSGSDSMSVI